MSDKLPAEVMENLLNAETVARIAYVDRRGLPCIVPITYAYDGKAFYGFSVPGAKIEFMGANPNVCVEVDRVYDNADWYSVVLRGVFEALSVVEADEALKLVRSRVRKAANLEDIAAGSAQTFVDRQGGVGIAYRIRITERHGRYSGPLLSNHEQGDSQQ